MKKNRCTSSGICRRTKVKYIVGVVDLIESVDRLDCAVHRKQAAKVGVTQDILLEVNIGNEEKQIRLRPTARQIAAKWQTIPHVRLHGLMAIPP